MRKILQIRDRRLRRVRRKRWQRQVSQRLKKNAQRKGLTFDGKVLEKVIRFPLAISIQNKKNRRFFMRSLIKFKRLVGLTPIILDFSETCMQYPSGVLLLLAEIDRQKRFLGSQFNANIILPKDDVSRQVFHQVGIAALFGKKSRRSNDGYDDSVRHWRYATGTHMTEAPGRSLERFEGRLSEELHSGMWRGVSEAIVNSIHHAYLEERRDGFRECAETRWWMFSQVRNGELTVAVCDLGIGIPRSLPLNWEFDRLQALMSKFGLSKPDVAAIKAALELGATRTQEDNRGRGLPQIWEDMKKHEGARILLLSNHALLNWNTKIQKQRDIEFSESIYGTLVIWTVPIDSLAKRND